MLGFRTWGLTMPNIRHVQPRSTIHDCLSLRAARGSTQTYCVSTYVIQEIGIGSRLARVQIGSMLQLGPFWPIPSWCITFHRNGSCDDRTFRVVM